MNLGASKAKAGVRTYQPSDRYIAFTRRTLVSAGIVILSVTGFLMLARADFDLDQITVIRLVTWVIIGGALCVYFLVGAKITARSLGQKYKLDLNARELVLESRGTRTEISWDDITKLHVLTDGLGEPMGVDIWSKTKRPLRLIGYEDKSDLVRTIESRAPLDASIQHKRKWMDWRNPWTLFAPVGSAISVGLLIEFNRRFGGENILEGLLSVICVSFGAYLLFRKPISKEDPSYKAAEVITASVFLVLGLLMLISPIW